MLHRDFLRIIEIGVDNPLTTILERIHIGNRSILIDFTESITDKFLLRLGGLYLLSLQPNKEVVVITLLIRTFQLDNVTQDDVLLILSLEILTLTQGIILDRDILEPQSKRATDSHIGIEKIIIVEQLGYLQMLLFASLLILNVTTV